ncbi:DNA-directed RNA polymerase subunit alpha [Prevotella sp. OH937_COT-195]|uniref:DNA-directed RNA polymerase subunit alpha n=1 Tax=Prevotella sp. OH937_COT-195 TaxID=2491051 RepID=UPI000F65492C|nr:DNA-directed RNA polymerase subunit alpha [Prevotella sp. OH937_COT-195]RRD02675.1 DNA-directed RNA polymerase subunit alpha [Prevotella sp. OH937_COT-195]
MEKIKVSTDTLYKYLKEHNFTFLVLSKYMEVSNGNMMGCFLHIPNRLGKPLTFSSSIIKKMNKAIERVADDMRKCVLVFGSDETFTNQRGKTYDPGLIKPISQGIGKFFKLRGMTERLLGWNLAKYSLTLSSPKSKIYGNITRDDADRLNAELLAIAGVLSSYEVVAGDELSVAQSITEPTMELRQPAEEADNGVPVSETEYTLDDLYRAFGEEKKASAARLRYALERKGVTTLQEFASLSTGQLLDMEGVGSGTLGLIHKAFKKMGVRW